MRRERAIRAARRRSARCLARACGTLLCLAVVPVADGEIEKNTPEPFRNVLIVHTFDPTVPYTQLQQHGIESVLQAPESIPVHIHHEYLDYLARSDEPYIKAIADLFVQRYEKRSFSLIITTDTGALDFMMRFGERFAPGVPIVFSAVQEGHPLLTHRPPNIAGVVEKIDVEATLDLALRLHPDTKHVFGITDRWQFGGRLQGMVEAALARCEPRPLVEWLVDMKPIDLEKRLADLPDDSIVLFCAGYNLRTRFHMSGETTLARLCRASTAPIFSFFDVYLGDGVVGGRLTSAELLGRHAGQVALQVLQGCAPAEIPLRYEGNTWAFDARALQRWGIPESALPPDSEIRFREQPWWLEHWPYWLAALGACSLQALVITVLFVQRVRLKRFDLALRASEERYHRATEAGRSGVWEWDVRTGAMYIDPQLKRLLGYRDDEIRNDIDDWTRLTHPDDRDRLKAEARAHLDGRADIYQVAHRMFCRDGSTRWLLARGQAICGASGDVVRIVGSDVDITDYKAAENELRLARDQLEERVAQRTHELQTVNQALRAEIVERGQAEAARRESEERFRQLVETTSDWVWAVDESGRYTYAGPQIRDILGYEPDEVLGRRPFELMSPADAQRVSGKFLELVKERRPFRLLETVNQHKDGRRVVLETSGVPFFDRNGLFRGYRGIDRDVTVRKAVVETLRAEHAFRTSVIQHAAEGLCVGHPIDAPQRLRFSVWNERMTQMTGYSMDEVNRIGWFEALYPDPLERNRAVARLETLQTGKDLRSEAWEITRKDGRRRVLQITTSILPVGGEQRHILGLMDDVTERRASEIALQESEERFRQIAEHIQDVFWMRDPHSGRMLYVSPAFEDIWGRPLSDIQQFDDVFIDLVVPEDRPRIRLGRSQYLRGERTTVEYRIVRPDGSIRDILDRAFPIVDAEGRVPRVVGLASDVTEARLAEQRQRQHEAELAHVARLSTLGEMASGLAHELNQPMAAIANYAAAASAAMQSGEPAAEVLEDLQRISEQAFRAGEIIRRLRGFIAKRDAQRAPANLNVLVQDSLHLMSPELSHAHIAVDLALDPQLPDTVVDAIQIEQVILNIVRNAAEAMRDSDDGDRRLTIRTEAVGPDRTRIVVCDTGPGVAPENRDRLFRPFYTTKSQGLGLGLWISQTLIDAHNGSLTAEPNADRGMTFTIDLPIRDEFPPRRRRAPASMTAAERDNTIASAVEAGRTKPRKSS